MHRIYRSNVLVCRGSGCTGSGSPKIIKILEEELIKQNLENEVRIVQTGCRGFCSKGPIVVIYPEEILYCDVSSDDVPEIVEETLIKGRTVKRLLYKDPITSQLVTHYSEIPFYKKQKRVLLKNCGFIDPENINEYIAEGGYEALGSAIFKMDPESVIEEIKKSGLRGRGGAGFPTGLKWEFTKNARGKKKYIICNADEGDPGAFMDRSILEADPHSVIEGMLIAGYAIGANEGFIYCRAEYALAIHRLKIALSQATDYGLIGENILGSDFSFRISIREGAGAFVCGEETALMASIEGRRGEPRTRPPYPAVKGLWGMPTNINNVKTYANVPRIILNGWKWFSSIGTEKSKGTKIFALTGQINNIGLIEVPMGITLGEIIFDIGGGILKDKKFKSVQTGGPLGGCLSVESLNTPIDYESLKEKGAVMGSGGMIVVDEDTCMVEFAKYFLKFSTNESCGKCVPCRVGGKRMYEILNNITEGKGKLEDLDEIEKLAKFMDQASLCALGQLTPSPVVATLRLFRDEYIAHIEDKRCPAGVCKVLVRSKCENACPASVDVPSYVALIAAGRYEEALNIHRKRNPFPAICGRVCPAFCEDKCKRGDVDEPIAIRALKRFMSDKEMKYPWTPEIIEDLKEEKVAIIGSGPAGLSAAYRLATWGYKVTIFEALPVVGGMMMVGIPDYRLPKDIINFEVDAIRRLGVNIKLNSPIGNELTLEDLFKQGFSAIILAVGAQKSGKLRITGEELEGVLSGIDFLKDVNLGKNIDLKDKKVAVIGGGNVAIDSSRSALRIGAKEVHILYRRTKMDMPAHKDEIEEAEKEGIKMRFLTTPVEILGNNGEVSSIECINMKLGEFDRSGRKRPIPIDGSEFTMDVDVVITAIGQVLDTSFLKKDKEIKISKGRFFEADFKTMATNVEGIFVAGDAVSGPATIIEAIASGEKAALGVDNYLRRGMAKEKEKETITIERTFELKEGEIPRIKIPVLEVKNRLSNFNEVELGLSEENAIFEAKRCLRCDLEEE
jgi:NADH-quinone oxidoreductase subunit F